MLHRLLQAVRGVLRPVVTSTQVILVRLRARRMSSRGDAVGRGDSQARRDLSNDRFGDVALQFHHVFCVGLVQFGPDMTLVLRFYQLYGDSDAAPCRPDAPLEQMAHTEVYTDLVGSFAG